METRNKRYIWNKNIYINKVQQTFGQRVIKYLQISIHLFKFQVSTYSIIPANLSFKIEGKVKAFSDKEQSLN